MRTRLYALTVLAASIAIPALASTASAEEMPTGTISPSGATANIKPPAGAGVVLDETQDAAKELLAKPAQGGYQAGLTNSPMEVGGNPDAGLGSLPLVGGLPGSGNGGAGGLLGGLAGGGGNGGLLGGLGG